MSFIQTPPQILDVNIGQRSTTTTTTRPWCETLVTEFMKRKVRDVLSFSSDLCDFPHSHRVVREIVLIGILNIVTNSKITQSYSIIV